MLDPIVRHLPCARDITCLHVGHHQCLIGGDEVKAGQLGPAGEQEGNRCGKLAAKLM
jgi:hypothetical protein